jgi:3-hydroxybutyryl-CoA dehydratase
MPGLVPGIHPSPSAAASGKMDSGDRRLNDKVRFVGPAMPLTNHRRIQRGPGRRPIMQEFYVKPGDSVSFAKTVGESDVYMFAGITGDLAPNHVNEQYMARSKYGKRIAHGALLIGYASTCSTMMIEKCNGHAGGETAVSLGYDKVRFLGPVHIGDTVTLTYTITEVDPVKRRSRSQIRIVNQNADLVGVAEHILAWVKNKA